MPEEFFIYHEVSVEHVPRILNEGLRASEESYRSGMEADLETIADKKNISLPVRRQDCVFCYASLRQAVEMASFETGAAGSLPPLLTRSALLVIDALQLRDVLYVADFDIFSEVIDLRHMDSPDNIIESESYEVALSNYAESVTPFKAFNSIAEIDSAFRRPELLIEKDISPSNIREVLLCKKILGAGWFSSYPALPTDE
jgi:hypothetical protein